MFAELEVLEVKMASMKVFMFCCGGVKRSGILFFYHFLAFCAQKKTKSRMQAEGIHGRTCFEIPGNDPIRFYHIGQSYYGFFHQNGN